MTADDCMFATARLLMKEWHSLAPQDWSPQALPEVVAELLTPGVTRQLPMGWQGSYTRERALQWIADRDAEGTTLLVVEKASGRPVGLVILGEATHAGTQELELRLGYLLSEAYWGKGMATELLHGFVAWSRTSGVASIVAGVGRGNPASRRVLEKSGFVRDPEPEEAGAEEQMFRLRFCEGGFE